MVLAVLFGPVAMLVSVGLALASIGASRHARDALAVSTVVVALALLALLVTSGAELRTWILD